MLNTVVLYALLPPQEAPADSILAPVHLLVTWIIAVLDLVAIQWLGLRVSAEGPTHLKALGLLPTWVFVVPLGFLWTFIDTLVRTDGHPPVSTPLDRLLHGVERPPRRARP